MASAWQTLEEAALTLGISSRTLHRRITRNEVETRLNNGRREVLVEIPDPPEPQEMQQADAHPQPTPVSVSHEESPQADNVRQTMLALSEDRIRRTDLAIMAYQQSVNVVAADARRTRNSARLAWSLTGTMIVALFLCITWATHRLTAAEGQVQRLSDQVETLSASAQQREAEATALRQQAASATVSAAKTEGELSATQKELSAMREQFGKSSEPTTRAANLIQRLSSALAGE
jgi:C4-dicarboxylate-specific signal transduction histidine kinase